jgi:hypothetical protein
MAKRAPGERAHAPHGGRGQRRQRGDAEGLQQKVGRDGAERAQKIGRRVGGRVVEAGVGRTVGRKRQKGRSRAQEQEQARAAQGQHAQEPGHGQPCLGQRVGHRRAP